MSKQNSNFFTNGVPVSIKEVAEMVANIITFESEHKYEMFVLDACNHIAKCIDNKIYENDMKQFRATWMEKHPPNHAGYYICHLCGGWVHKDEFELDHVKPKSILRGEDPNRDENVRPSHAWPILKDDGTMVCPGNRGKGSKNWPSVTDEITPPDEAC